MANAVLTGGLFSQFEQGGHAAELLRLTVECAVPLWIERAKHMTEAERTSRASMCAQIIAEKGDVIMFKSKKAGETAGAVNALCEGLALCSFAPGGVKFLGLVFETRLE